MQRLHVTNGDVAAGRIAGLVAPEPVLPWRDMLHDGPVPAGLDLEALSAERARYLAGRFRLDAEATLQRFRERDRRIREALARGDALVLWFEHDLYDQLQLLQLLDLAGGAGVPPARLRLSQADGHLAGLDEGELAALGRAAPEVNESQIGLAREAWAAFRAPTPEALVWLAEADTSALPWLRPAIGRLLEELPSGYPGLSRTERHILEALEAGPVAAGALFGRVQAQEEAWFMGDWPFFATLDELAAEPSPLVTGLPPGGFPFEGGEATRKAYLEAEARITDDGRLVREGRLDRAVVKPLDRWLGGTHLTGGNVWRWEPATALLMQG